MPHIRAQNDVAAPGLGGGPWGGHSDRQQLHSAEQLGLHPCPIMSTVGVGLVILTLVSLCSPGPLSCSGRLHPCHQL